MLENEKKIVKELRNEKTDGAFERNELELIFLDCVNEVKSQIQKRRDLQMDDQMFTKSAKDGNRRGQTPS